MHLLKFFSLARSSTEFECAWRGSVKRFSDFMNAIHTSKSKQEAFESFLKKMMRDKQSGLKSSRDSHASRISSFLFDSINVSHWVLLWSEGANEISIYICFVEIKTVKLDKKDLFHENLCLSGSLSHSHSLSLSLSLSLSYTPAYR